MRRPLNKWLKACLLGGAAGVVLGGLAIAGTTQVPSGVVAPLRPSTLSSVSTPTYSFASETNTGIDLSAQTNGNMYFILRGTAMAALRGNGDLLVPGGVSFGANVGAPDVFLTRDAANIAALRNGTSAQTLRVANTYTDSSNGEWFQVDWTTQANIATLKATNNGTGSQRPMALQASDLQLWTGSTRRWNFDGSGNFVANADNTYDIGASGATRPRAIYVAGLGNFGGAVVSGGSVQTQATTVSNLPTCNSGNKAMRNFVTDATQTFASANFGATVTGSGANNVPVVCDGTNWKIG